MNAILLSVLAGLCWGVGEVFTKSVLHTKQIGPLTAIAVRSTVALPMIWCAWWLAMYAWKSEPRNWLHADAAVLWKLVLGSGLVAGAGGMVCFYAGLNLGEVSRIKPIAFSFAPLTGVLLGAIVLRESMSLQKAVAVLLIIAGVVLLTAGSGSKVGSGSDAPQATPLH